MFFGVFVRFYWIAMIIFAAYMVGAFSANHAPFDPVYLELGR